MRGRNLKAVWARAAAVGGFGALLFTVGCGAAPNGATGVVQSAAVAQAGTPVVVSCEPNQRALVRPAVVNGAAVSQVECVSSGEVAAYAQSPASQPGVVPVN